MKRTTTTRIASNQMLLNFGRTRSLGGSKHEIGDSRTPSSKSSLQRIGGVDLSVRRSGVLHFIDTRRASLKVHYVIPYSWSPASSSNASSGTTTSQVSQRRVRLYASKSCWQRGAVGVAQHQGHHVPRVGSPADGPPNIGVSGSVCSKP